MSDQLTLVTPSVVEGCHLPGSCLDSARHDVWSCGYLMSIVTLSPSAKSIASPSTSLGMNFVERLGVILVEGLGMTCIVCDTTVIVTQIQSLTD